MDQVRRGLLGRCAPAARAASVCLLLAAGAVLGLGQAAGARIDEGMLTLGGQLMRYADATRQQEPRDLVINGVTLRLSAGTTERSVAQVLEHFTELCRARSGGIAQRELPGLPGDLGLPAPIFRAEAERQGAVGCIDLGDARLSYRELWRRAERFAQTTDLGALGQIRYVLAKQSGQGTFFLTLWSEEGLPLERMFPAEGDAPGHDPRLLPRPADSDRLLSVFERNQRPSMFVYRAPDTPWRALEVRYRKRLKAKGWALTEAKAYGGRGQSFVAERQGSTVLVSILPGDAGEEGGALVSLSL